LTREGIGRPRIERWPGPPPPRGWRLWCGTRAQRTSSPRRRGPSTQRSGCHAAVARHHVISSRH